MSCLRVITVCVAVVVGLGGGSASAQNCFLFFCQEQPRWQATPPLEPERQDEGAPPFSGRPDRQYSTMYAAINGEPFPVPALQLSDVDPTYLRASIYYRTSEAPGTIVIDPQRHFLYLVEGGGRAGFGWSGIATVRNKQEWPDWYPPKEMIERQPEIRRVMSELQSGLG